MTIARTPVYGRRLLPRTLARLSDLYGADLTGVRVEVSPLPAPVAALAGPERVLLSTGVGGLPPAGQFHILAHEMAHVLQLRRGQVAPGTGAPPCLVLDDALEDEAHEAARRARAGRRVAIAGRIAGRGVDGSRTPILPLIINVGHDEFSTEFRKVEGWIVAKDVYCALQHSGNMQDRLIELNQCVGTPVGANENIYLQGHGFPGGLGGKLHIGLVAQNLNRLAFAPNYAGEIRIYCCSAGAGAGRGLVSFASVESAIKQLRMQLSVGGVRISGAAGISLNSPDYPNGTRVLGADAAAQQRVFQQIDAQRGPVDAAWYAYVINSLPNIGAIPGNILREAAQYAYLICREFYQQLAVACHADLKPIGTDIAVGVSIHGGRARAAEV